jgi:hypothetical protein
LPIRESGIPVIALIGMAFGVALDALYTCWSIYWAEGELHR